MCLWDLPKTKMNNYEWCACAYYTGRVFFKEILCRCRYYTFTLCVTERGGLTSFYLFNVKNIILYNLLSLITTEVFIVLRSYFIFKAIWCRYTDTIMSAIGIDSYNFNLFLMVLLFVLVNIQMKNGNL